MAKNGEDRKVVKHQNGWSVKMKEAKRESFVFDTQANAIARARARLIVDKTSRGLGKVRIQALDGRLRSDSGRRNESSAWDRR